MQLQSCHNKPQSYEITAVIVVLMFRFLRDYTSFPQI